MAVMEVLPAETSVFMLQHCWLGREVFKSTGAKFGQNAVLHIGSCKYLCQLWPREDRKEGYVKLHTAVCDHMTTSLGVDTLHTECIQLQSLQPVKAVSVTVVLAHLVSQYKRLEHDVKTILREVCLKENFCLRCHDTALGKLFGIAYIVINKLPKNVECGRVKPSAKITVDNVMSLNKFRQNHFQQKRFNPIGGFDHLISVLKELVELPYKRRKQMSGVPYPRGILLYGPSGSGKTSLVRHVASITDAYMVCVKGSELIGARPGDSEGNLSKMFEEARDMSEEGPCVLFLDEVDGLAGNTGKGSSSMSSSILSHLLRLLDDMTDSHLTVIAATSHIDAIDHRLRQAGRLEKELMVGVPTYEQRRQMLSVLFAGLPCSPDLCVASVAEKTPGFLPADLASLIQCARTKHNQQALSSADIDKALHEVRPSTQRDSDVVAHHKPVAWSDIGGLDDVKLQLQQAIEWPRRHSAAFKRMGIPRPKGVLLTGPPGCAKTLLVRAAASACHVTFLSLSAGHLYSPYVGQAEKKVREVFQQARAGAPSILFIDEIDCVVGKRMDGQGGKGVQERVLSTLLNELDGIGGGTQQQMAAGADGGVILVAATNRPDMLDDAIKRPGRIDRIVQVPWPDIQTRHKILEVHTKKIPLQDVDLMKIAAETTGFSGAELEDLCRESALKAMSEGGCGVRPVLQCHVEAALADAAHTAHAGQGDMASSLGL